MAPREVWIVGDPDDRSRARSHRYHRGDCYVLDQVGNYDHKRKVLLERLPEGYTPCQLCAPGGGSTARARGRPTDEEPPRRSSIQPGALVHVQDLDTGRSSEYRIGSVGQSGVSPESPLGAALLGRVTGEVVEFTPPKGGLRRLRIMRFEASV